MNKKISDFTELTTPADGDLMEIVDVSDTSEAPTGTNKKIAFSNITIADASTTVKGKVELATTAETETGTDATRAVTPDSYRNAFATTEAAIVHAATGKTTPADADELGLIDSAASYVLKKLTFLNLKVAIMSALNPIGTIREFNVSTNPATLLGFGTWSAFGTGRVTVAIDVGQTEFDTNGETGGAKTHTLTGAESGTSVHSHGISDPGHFHTIGTTAGDQDGSGSNGSINGSSNTDTKTTGITVSNSSEANASSAHNNLQPYIVVYRWVRSA